MELRIVQLRKKNGITQQTLADACRTSQQQIAKIENGVVDPQLSTLRRIAHALHCETRDLFYSKEDFLRDIQLVVKDAGIKVSKISILELNSICAQVQNIPAMHPFWEHIIIKNNKVQFKEER